MLLNILVTGTAGFVGSQLVTGLLNEGHKVWGIDNINTYYDVKLKYDRLKNSGIFEDHIAWGKWTESAQNNHYNFARIDICVLEDVLRATEEIKFDLVINLAAQAGVRYSIENPRAYADSNLVGFLNILEFCRLRKVKRLIYASSSSVYGNQASIPFSESDKTDNPISLYAATKKSNELMAHSYGHLYGINTIGLRFFTVYGPWGRPDMAPMIFAKAAVKKETIKVFNEGKQSRDFTFIDDIIDGIISCINIQNLEGHFNVFNLGKGSPINLEDFIDELEDALSVKINRKLYPSQPGDVSRTYADISKLQKLTGYLPKTDLNQGIKIFAKWYLDYYQRNANSNK